ncbi:MAG: OsmC family protein [Anaerolineales bacterium]
MNEEKPKNLWKEITATWDGAEGYIAQNKAGASVLMGKGRGGEPGISPMDMLLAGLAGCTGMDIISILRKKRQEPSAFQVKVRGNQKVDDYPMPYTEFQVEYLLWGEELKVKDVEQAIQLSEEKYCSVGVTLSQAGKIHSTYRILKPGEKTE